MFYLSVQVIFFLLYLDLTDRRITHCDGKPGGKPFPTGSIGLNSPRLTTAHGTHTFPGSFLNINTQRCVLKKIFAKLYNVRIQEYNFDQIKKIVA